MEYRRLGRSGLIVSEVGLGTNNFGTRLDEPRTRAILDTALEIGITFIDTADGYGRGASEELIGRILHGRRHEYVLATKLGSPMGDAPWERGLSRRWIMQAAEASLRRLHTDHLDLCQVHFPDPETPLEETLRALDDLVSAGKVRYLGWSNHPAWQVVDGQWIARTQHLAAPISVQDHFSLLTRDPERELLPAARAFGLGVIPYFPLESGFLTGKYRLGQTPARARLEGSARAESVLTGANFDRLARWEDFALARGRSITELAFGWLLSHPEVSSVIAGASSPEQVRANVTNAAWRLDAAEMEAVAALA